jgi:predicted DsbA family dithiol-disulfide isomerase
MENLKQFAIDLGLDAQAFNECLDSGKFTQLVQELTQTAKDIGVNSTPAFVVNGHTILGAQSYEIFEQAIEQELDSAAP